MSPLVFHSLIIPTTMLMACAAHAENGTGATVSTSNCQWAFTVDETESAIPSWLQGEGLTFAPATEGRAVPLNTMVVMPSPSVDDEAMLIIEFSRHDLNEAFVQAYFFDRQALIPMDHPYTRMGVEYILTDERLLLKIHPDMVFHLRDDSSGMTHDVRDVPDYRRQMFTSPDIGDMFKRDDVAGRVILVSGNVYMSDDPDRVRALFGHVYQSVRATAPGKPIMLRCGLSESVTATTPVQLLPQGFPPRVVSGR